MYSGKFPCSLIINKINANNYYANKTDDSVHIRTQVNIEPVYFTFSPENYATFAQSWTVISLCDLYWYDLSSFQR